MRSWTTSSARPRSPRVPADVGGPWTTRCRKIIKDHFKTFSAAMCDVVKVGGCTLRERLVRDEAAWMVNKKEQRMGSGYYRALKAEWDAAERPACSLEVERPEEAVLWERGLGFDLPRGWHQRCPSLTSHANLA